MRETFRPVLPSRANCIVSPPMSLICCPRERAVKYLYPFPRTRPYPYGLIVKIDPSPLPKTSGK